MAQIPTPPAGADFAYGVAHEVLEDQLRRIDAQDSKAGLLIAAAGIFAGFVFSGRSFLIEAPKLLLVAVGLAISVAVLFALFASLNQLYRRAPEPVAVANFATQDAEWLKWRFLGNMHVAIHWNRRKLNRKTRFLTIGQVSLLAAVLLVGGYFVLDTLTS